MAHAAHVGGHNMRDMTATSVDEMSSANFVRRSFVASVVLLIKLELTEVAHNNQKAKLLRWAGFN